MAKNNKGVKLETVRRLKKIASSYGKDVTIENVMEDKRFTSLFDTYMNKRERQVAKEVVNLVIEGITKGLTEDEITLMATNLPEAEEVVEADTELEKATEEIFMISQQKVVEVASPVSVEVGESTETDNTIVTNDTAVELVSDSNSDDDCKTELEKAAEEIFMISQQKVIEVASKIKEALEHVERSDENKETNVPHESGKRSSKNNTTSDSMCSLKNIWNNSYVGISLGTLFGK